MLKTIKVIEGNNLRTSLVLPDSFDLRTEPVGIKLAKAWVSETLDVEVNWEMWTGTNYTAKLTFNRDGDISVGEGVFVLFDEVFANEIEVVTLADLTVKVQTPDLGMVKVGDIGISLRDGYTEEA